MLEAYLKLHHSYNEDFVFVSRDVPGYEGSKDFAFFPFAKLEQYINSLPEEQRYFYEIEVNKDPINQRRKLKIDFDVPMFLDKQKTKPNPDFPRAKELGSSIAVDLRRYMELTFKELWPEQILHEDTVLLFDSNTAEKVSYHAIINGFCVADEDQAKVFMRSLRTVQWEWAKFVDVSPYSSFQNFRLPKCHKEGKTNRKLTAKLPGGGYPSFLDSLTTYVRGCVDLPTLPVETRRAARLVEISSDASDSVMEMFNSIDEYSDKWELRDIKNGMFVLRQLEACWCPLCEREHDGASANNSFFLTLNEERDVTLRCRRFLDEGGKGGKLLFNLETGHIGDEEEQIKPHKRLLPRRQVKTAQIRFEDEKDPESSEDESESSEDEDSDKPAIEAFDTMGVVSDLYDKYEQISTLEAYNVWKKQALNALDICCKFIHGTSKAYVIYSTVESSSLGFPTIRWIRKNISCFIEAFCNTPVRLWAITGDKTSGPVGFPKKLAELAWLIDPKRVSYAGEQFCPPEEETRGKFNAWTGVAITRKLAQQRGDVAKASKLCAFIKREWCGSNQQLYDHVMNWLAHLIQFPAVKLETSLVLKGSEGAGKGMVVQLMAKILGQHNFTQPEAQQVFGGFNGQLANKLLVYADEMFWGGDKSIRGALFKYITEHTMTVNEKYGPIVETDNRTSWIMASNEHQIVPAGPQARRFQCLEVSNGLLSKTRNEKKELAETCPFSFALALYERDLTDWDSRKIITTQALLDQKEEGMDKVHVWLREAIENDELTWGLRMSKKALAEKCQSSLSGYRLSAAAIGKRLAQIWKFDGKNKVEDTISKKRVNAFDIPSKEELIKAFNAYYGGTIISDVKCDGEAS